MSPVINVGHAITMTYDNAAVTNEQINQKLHDVRNTCSIFTSHDYQKNKFAYSCTIIFTVVSHWLEYRVLPEILYCKLKTNIVKRYPHYRPWRPTWDAYAWVHIQSVREISAILLTIVGDGWKDQKCIHRIMRLNLIVFSAKDVFFFSFVHVVRKHAKTCENIYISNVILQGLNIISKKYTCSM